MQQQFWDRSPIAFMPQQKSVAVLRKNVTGLQLGAQPDFIRYGNTRKTQASVPPPLPQRREVVLRQPEVLRREKEPTRALPRSFLVLHQVFEPLR